MEDAQALKALDNSNELEITVTGRKTRRQYTTPVWFVYESTTVFLLPGGGFKSNWYKNAMHFKRIKISYGKTSVDLIPNPVTDPARLASLVDKFRKKYGPTYYSDPRRFEVAVELTIP